MRTIKIWLALLLTLAFTFEAFGQNRRSYIIGSGTPEGSETAEIGMIYVDRDSATTYVKSTYGGNTGWLELSQAASQTLTNTTLLGATLIGTGGTATNLTLVGVTTGGTITNATLLGATRIGTGAISTNLTLTGTTTGGTITNLTLVGVTDIQGAATATTLLVTGLTNSAFTASLPVWSSSTKVAETRSIEASKTALGIQAGSGTTADDNTVTNTFATVFSTPPIVVTTPVTTDNILTNLVSAITESNFVVNVGANAILVNWIAIGAP